MPIKTNRFKKPIIDLEKLSKKNKERSKAIDKNLRPQGQNGADRIEPEPNYNAASGERVYKHKNSYIVLGKDRHASLKSATVGSGASMIDLVAGRGSSHRPVRKKFGSTPDKDVTMNPNFFNDAARIYISQRADIDYYFGIAAERIDDKDARSGIGLKADCVRIVGRRNIKIVTGKATAKGHGSDGELNSQGGKIDGPGTISLVAGNYTGQSTVPILPFFGKVGEVLQAGEPEQLKVLQPIPKGDNLIACIRHIADMVSDLSSMVMLNSQGIKEIAGATALHFHDYGGGFGPTTPSSLLAAEMVPTYIQAWLNLMQNYSNTWNQIVLENDFLNETSPLYINSRHVSTT